MQGYALQAGFRSSAGSVFWRTIPGVKPGDMVAVSGDSALLVPGSCILAPENGVFIVGCGMERNEGHLVDALALRGDEGRSTLRKAWGRCERSLIPGSPNGATHPARGILS